MNDAIRIKCWSCHEGMTLFEHGEADGMCPCCGLEVDISEYLDEAIKQNIKLEAEAQALREEVAAANERQGILEHRLMRVMTRHFAEAWSKRDTDKTLEGYLSAGIAELEGERDAALEEVAALRARVVVVPGRQSRKEAFECGGVAQEQFATGWNYCLDNLARLNGKAVSEGLLRRVLNVESDDFMLAMNELRELLGD